MALRVRAYIHPRNFLNFYTVIAILVLFENFLEIIVVHFLFSIRHLHQIMKFFRRHICDNGTKGVHRAI